MDGWDEAARSWDAGHDWYARQVEPLTAWFCDSVARPGARVLDLASGTGVPALAVAERVGPEGRVVAIDASPAMTRALARRARDAGLAQVDARTMDASAIEFAEHSFDAVSCACGLMFFLDPLAVLARVRHVLVAGGRVAVAVWDDLASCPFFAVALGAIASVFPGPPSRALDLEGLLGEAGFVAVAVTRRPLMFELPSLEAYWSILTSFAPGVSQKLAAAGAHDRARIREALTERAAPFERGGGLALPAVALCATGRAPQPSTARSRLQPHAEGS